MLYYDFSLTLDYRIKNIDLSIQEIYANPVNLSPAPTPMLLVKNPTQDVINSIAKESTVYFDGTNIKPVFYTVIALKYLFKL